MFAIGTKKSSTLHAGQPIVRKRLTVIARPTHANGIDAVNIQPTNATSDGESACSGTGAPSGTR